MAVMRSVRKWRKSLRSSVAKSWPVTGLRLERRIWMMAKRRSVRRMAVSILPDY